VLTSVAQESMGDLGHAVSLSQMVLRRARWAMEGGCAGVVCSGHEARRVREVVGDEAVIVTPGIRMAGGSVDDQARVMTPARALEEGADYIVVGRPIRDAASPAEAADRIAEQMAGS
jgi:orotidine-5'-phosphate decarboxylase